MEKMVCSYCPAHKGKKVALLYLTIPAYSLDFL